MHRVKHSDKRVCASKQASRAFVRRSSARRARCAIQCPTHERPTRSLALRTPPSPAPLSFKSESLSCDLVLCSQAPNLFSLALSCSRTFSRCLALSRSLALSLCRFLSRSLSRSLSLSLALSRPLSPPLTPSHPLSPPLAPARSRSLPFASFRSLSLPLAPSRFLLLSLAQQ